MNVGELIEQLKKLPVTLPVQAWAFEYAEAAELVEATARVTTDSVVIEA